MLRSSALTIPIDTELEKPSGLPIAMTASPWRSASLSPIVAVGSGLSTFTLITAMSASTASATSSARTRTPSANVTRNSLPPSTTCLLVTM